MFVNVMCTVFFIGSILFTGNEGLVSPDVMLPDYAVDSSVSGGDSLLSSTPDDDNIFSNDVTLFSEGMESLAAAQSSAAEAYLSTAIIDVMERVVNGKPFCRYVAYRNSVSDSSTATLLYGTRSSSSSGSSITVENGYKIDYYRVAYQNGYQTYYEYKYTINPIDEYTVNYSNSTLLYTNCVPGYPTLGFNYSFILLIMVVAVLLIFIFRRN